MAYSDSELISFIRESANNNNGFPKNADFRKNKHYPSVPTLERRFGSWKKAIEAAGYKYPNKAASSVFTLKTALSICCNKYNYNIPIGYNITLEELIIFISKKEPLHKNPFGFSKTKWNTFIYAVFPDKPKGSINYNWLLIKNNWLLCYRCGFVKNTTEFNKDKTAKFGFNTLCKECCKPKNNAYTAVRRANKIKATPSWANLDKIKEIYSNCPEGYHVDHIIPLQGVNVCGLHVETNLQYLPATENLSKNNKFSSW